MNFWFIGNFSIRIQVEVPSKHIKHNGIQHKTEYTEYFNQMCVRNEIKKY